MPISLKFENLLDETELKNRLKADFSNYVIQGLQFEKGFQIRKSKFTTQNFPIKIKASKKTIAVGSTLDNLVLFCFFCLPLGLYLYFNRHKHKEMQRIIVDKITSYHKDIA